MASWLLVGVFFTSFPHGHLSIESDCCRHCNRASGQRLGPQTWTKVSIHRDFVVHWFLDCATRGLLWADVARQQHGSVQERADGGRS
jgi:hypothetical protein